LIAGDGIGPEITAAVVEVFDALGRPFAWEPCAMGKAAFAEHGDPLPPATVESFRRTRLALKGPIETPLGTGFRSPLVRLREDFQLFANLRPARTLVPGGRFDGIDIVLVRENTEGLYVGHERYVAIGDDPHGMAMATGWNTRAGCERVLRFAFDHALATGRRKVTVVHKANVLKALTGLFLETAREMYARDYAGRLQMEEMIVDACAMKLVMDPWRFDVIVTTNLFGDILSDEIAGLTGGLGLAPGANIGRDAALFEAVHGSAPDIAGQGIANPVALLLAGAMMLEHAGLAGLATRLRRAVEHTLNVQQVRTPDLGGQAATNDFAKAVVRGLAAAD
jgi:isocitrate dehydrogenase (NAD+)